MLSSRSVLSTRYSPRALLMLIYVYFVALLLPLFIAAVFTVVFLIAATNLLCISPAPSLFLPSDPPPSPSPFLGILHLPTPPRATPPPDPAADITRKDEAVGNQTSGCEA